ncbi:MAG TPA: AsmA-like C-terminal region-containing protein [Elusimicrobiales bacterium]|nr:AsmA-like C-terminal region-containing protein [Elusimicrobiales bacterium]
MNLFKQILVRVIFLPFILAAGLAATAFTVARLMITPEDLKSLVTYQFQEMLRQPVRIEWAKLSVTGEVQIKGLRVTEPGPEVVDFFTAEYIYASVRLLPLLKRKLEIGEITFVSPRIELIKNKDGRWNVGTIFSGYRQTGKKHSLNKINRAEIKDGEVIITDKISGRRHTFESFNLSLKDFKPGEDTLFDVSMFFRSDSLRKPVEGRLYAEGSVNFAGFNWPLAEIKDLRADATIMNKSAAFTGTIKNFRRPAFDLKAETPDFKSSELAYLFTPAWPFRVPRASWDISAVFTSTKIVTVALTARPMNLKAEGTLDFSLSTPAYNFTMAAPPLSIALLKGYTELPVDNPSGKIHPRIRVASKDGKPVLSSVFASVTGSAFNYRALSAADLKLTALLSENFAKSYITASEGRLALGKARLTDLKLKTNISKEELSLEYAGRLNKEAVKGRMAIVDPFSAAKTVYFTGYSKKMVYAETKKLIFDIIALRAPQKRKPAKTSQLLWLRTLKNSIPSGYAFFKLLYKAGHFRHEYMEADNFYAAAALNNITGAIEQLNGDIYMKTGRGTFYDIEGTSEKDRVFYIFSIPLRLIYKMNRTGALKFGYKLKNISFTSMGGDYSLASGKMLIRNFYLVGPEFSASITGQLDFSNETMNLKIYTISGKYYSMGSLPEGLTDASGKPALAFTLKGKMADPVVSMIGSKDSGRMIKEASGKASGINLDRLNSLMGGKQ